MKTRDNLQRDFLLAFGAFLFALILWQFSPFSPLVYPLRLFVTLVHELGHGTTALLTGGHFANFQVKSNGAGLAYTSGGVRPVVIAAGYMGTAIFGATLLYATNRVQHPNYIAGGLGAVIFAATLFYSGLDGDNISLLDVIVLLGVFILLAAGMWARKELKVELAVVIFGLILLFFAAGGNWLTLLVGTLCGIALMLLSYYGERDYVVFVLNFLAFVVGLNAITDAWVLLQIVSNSSLVPQNDATSMARETALSADFWAIVWIGFAVLLLGAASLFTFIRPLRSRTPNDS